MGRIVFSWLVVSLSVWGFMFVTNAKQKKDFLWWAVQAGVALTIGGLIIGLAVVVLNRL